LIAPPLLGPIMNPVKRPPFTNVELLKKPIGMPFTNTEKRIEEIQ